jgi:hypothetical protein
MLALAIEFSRCPRARTLKAEQRVPLAPKRERTTSDRPGVSRYLEVDHEDRSAKRLLRKEVIQPHLPVRLPCYDFTPIASPTFDGSLHKG